MEKLTCCRTAATGTATAVLVVLCWLAPGTAGARDRYGGEETPIWEEVDAARAARREALLAEGPEIREPFFAFLVGLAEGDSLGAWSGADIDSFAQRRGTPSRFPVDLVGEVVRRRPLPAEQASWPVAAVKAVWEITLTENLDRPLPYNILGYHPGSLRVSRRLLLTETGAGTLAAHQGDQVFVFGRVTMLRLDEGHVILDVDGLVDRLLGKSLDDAATVGFVLARQDSTLLGVAVSLGRNQRRIYGEFDFRRDEILPHGRPAAQALSSACRRRMLEGHTGPPLGAWVED